MDPEIRECYEILELPPGAPMEAVQEAYEELADLWHPDQYADSPRHRRRAQQKFMKIRMSYEVLLDFFMNEAIPPDPRQLAGGTRPPQQGRQLPPGQRPAGGPQGRRALPPGQAQRQQPHPQRPSGPGQQRRPQSQNAANGPQGRQPVRRGPDGRPLPPQHPGRAPGSPQGATVAEARQPGASGSKGTPRGKSGTTAVARAMQKAKKPDGPTKTLVKYKDEKGRTRFRKEDRTETEEEREERLAAEAAKKLGFIGVMRWLLFLPVAIALGAAVYMGAVYMLEEAVVDRAVASKVDQFSAQVEERVGEAPNPLQTPVTRDDIVQPQIWQFVLYHFAVMLAAFFYGSVGTMIAPAKRKGANILLGVAASAMCYYLVTHLGKDDQVQMVHNFVFFLAFVGGAVGGTNLFNRYHSKTLMKKKAARARRRAEARARRYGEAT